MAVLAEASATLETHIPVLSRTVTELSATLTQVLGSIPGVRRSVRSS